MVNISAMFATPLILDNEFSRSIESNHTELKETIKYLVDGWERKDTCPTCGSNKCTAGAFHQIGIQNYFNNSEQTLFDFSSEFEIIKKFEQYCTKKLDYCLSDVFYKENKEGGIITDSWINVTSSDRAYQPMHCHANSYLSATYYINYDEEKHQPLIFDRDEEKHLLLNDLDELKDSDLGKYCKRFYTPTINEGDLLIWPSHIIHGYGSNHSSQIHRSGRCSISLNYLPKRISFGGYSFSISR
jgi:uncharacterized protein (TIGR02466 family)